MGPRKLCLIALLWLSAFVVVAPAASAAPFEEAERRQVEEIIREYLLAHPELMIEVMERLQAKRKSEAEAQDKQFVTALRQELFHSEHDFVANPQGRIPVVEFFDYQCGYCKRVYPALKQVRGSEPDVRIIYKEFPILGPVSIYASRAAVAARMQDKYLPFHDALMAREGQLDENAVLEVAGEVGLDVERLRRDMDLPEVRESIEFNLALGRQIEVRGTPTLFVGQTRLPGAVPLDQLLSHIAEARDNCSVC